MASSLPVAVRPEPSVDTPSPAWREPDERSGTDESPVSILGALPSPSALTAGPPGVFASNPDSGLFISNPVPESAPTLMSESAPVHFPIVSMRSKLGRTRLATACVTFPTGLASAAPMGSTTSIAFAAISAPFPTFESFDPALPNLPAFDAWPATGMRKVATSKTVAPKARAGSSFHSST